MSSKLSISDLFEQCDVGKKGWLNLNDLKSVSPDISTEELRYIFEQLDSSQNGKVTKKDFVDSFETVLRNGEKSGFKGIKRRASIQMSKTIDKKVLERRIQPEITYNSGPDENDLPWYGHVILIYYIILIHYTSYIHLHQYHIIYAKSCTC